MDRNVAASFSLSVLTVLVFAVVLYQPDPPQRGPAVRPVPVPSTTDPDDLSQAGAAAEVIEAHDPDAPGPAPAPARPVAATAGVEARSSGAGVEAVPAIRVAARALPSSAAPAGGRASRPRLAARREPAALPDARRLPEGPLPARVATRPVTAPEEPRGAFTKVRPGETLASIAVRVYGSEDDAERLWMANRDLLDGQDAPLHAGAMLRTP